MIIYLACFIVYVNNYSRRTQNQEKDRDSNDFSKDNNAALSSHTSCGCKYRDPGI